MHELAVASNIMAAAAAESGRPGSRAPRRLTVRVGALSGVDAESLEFCLGVAKEDGPLANVAIVVTRVGAGVTCPSCGEVPAEPGFSLACPRCGGAATVGEGGRDLEVWLETEDDDEDRPHEAGARGE